MNTHAQVAPIFALKISDISIRQDAEGRYCLNDMHKASGNKDKHRPGLWMENQQTKDLIAELEKDEAGIPASKILRGRGIQGTYVVKELVYAYAMWISASFSLKVIRAYDALATNAKTQLPKPAQIKSLMAEGYVVSPADQLIRKFAEFLTFNKCPDNMDNLPAPSPLLTRAELEAFVEELKVKSVTGELLPKLQPHGLTISLTPLENKGQVRRWLVTQLYDQGLIMHSIGDDKELMTLAEAAGKLRDKGCIVVRRDEHGIRSMVMDDIPVQFLTDIIEAAAQRLKRIEAGRKR